MKRKIGTKTRRKGCFEYGYVARPSQMFGKMIPFSPHWWAQYLGNGLDATFKTKRECLVWMREWSCE